MIKINDSVMLRVEGDIGFIACSNPPVNALKFEVRTGVITAVATLNADPAVRAIVLYCEGSTFFAGADISEFGKPAQEPRLNQTIMALENSPKPVIAAVHGTALGGGMEMALGCPFRVAVPSARLGLPEITLGLIAGAGGTQRLPRIIGAEQALRFVLSGTPVDAEEALALHILDSVADGEPAAIGAAFARRVLDEALPIVPVRARDDKLAETRADPSRFEALAKSLTQRTAGQAAPDASVASVRRAFTLPFDEAIAIDTGVNLELMAGSQSRALRHLFFAERMAMRIPGLPAPPRNHGLTSVAVVGAGTMGGGIAMCFANAGIPTVLIDTTQEALDRWRMQAENLYRGSVARGSISEAQMQQRLALLTPTLDMRATASADLVVEAVFESLDVKKQTFTAIEHYVKPGTILATNTSALDIDDIAATLQHPERFVGMHFFAPANVMKLLEVVAAAKSSADTLLTAMAIGRSVGKVPVLAGNCDGFIGNRMVLKRAAQAEWLLQHGALPHQVDAALTNMGFPMGPLATNDMSGLDIGYAIRKRRGTPFPIADALVENGRLGQKTAGGYYRYQPGDRLPANAPETEAIILTVSERMGIARRYIPEHETVERLLFPIINEAARILEEGIARRPSDIDLVWVYGYGWPRHLGGPLFYADETGLAKIVARLGQMAAETPDDASLKPASLLVDIAESGLTFHEWGARV